MALSSITKKLIMSISGLFLIVFLLLHMTINFFSVIDTFTGKYGAADGLFQTGCDFMALPIVTIMVPVLVGYESGGLHGYPYGVFDHIGRLIDKGVSAGRVQYLLGAFVKSVCEA